VVDEPPRLHKPDERDRTKDEIPSDADTPGYALQAAEDALAEYGPVEVYSPAEGLPKETISALEAAQGAFPEYPPVVIYSPTEGGPEETIVCSERKKISAIEQGVQDLVGLLGVIARLASDSDAVNNAPDVPAIIEFLDDRLQSTGKPYLTAPEANALLAEQGLLNDSPSNHGAPLRRLLRAGLIPHAYQPSGRGGRWFIPHSSSRAH
jgi:hypothetical protein